MTPRSIVSRDLDGRVAQGWGGSAPEGVHVNLILARRGSPTAAALVSAYAAPTAGFVPILACAGPDQQSYETVQPPTLLLPKVAADDAMQALLSGAVQVGAGQAVLDCVAEELIDGDQEHVVFVSVWVDPDARDETAVRHAARAAVGSALREAVTGRAPADVQSLVERRETLDHPFYGGR